VADPAIRSIVIAGKGKKFMAGADISQFGALFAEEPTLSELTEIIEQSSKPVVSAMERFVLGGGFEIALSSHYRIAHTDTIFGFPEVDIGILPGATGTQRFPRLVGLERALDVISTGERFDARQALQIGAIDKLVNKNVLEEAVQFASRMSLECVDARRTSRMSVKDSANADVLYRKAIEKAARRFPGLMAPVFAIKAVMASVTEPTYEQGIAKEKEFAYVLFFSGQARALQYAFFAQRKAIQWSLPDGSGCYKTAKPLPVRSVGVIGAGTMGSGIVMAMLNKDIPVTLVEQNEQMLDRGMKSLKALYDGSVRLRRVTHFQAGIRLKRCHPTTDFEELKDVDLVIEAVFEKLSVKKEVFAVLDRVCKPDAILCTNTSYLSIDVIASATQRPEKVIGTHFFVPAYHMKLLETIRGKATSPQTITTVTQLGQHIGKVPVLVGNCHGFVANRLYALCNIEALFMVEEGCSPFDVDQVSEDFGLPLGPFKIMDLSGLDIGKYMIEERAKSLGLTVSEDTRVFNGSRLCPLTIQLVNRGRLGRKSGSGWYDYEGPGGKVPYESAFVADLLTNYRRKHNIERRQITPQEIHERLVYSVINEGFKVLDEGIAGNQEAVDTIMMLGFGWPRQTGGPMYYARTVGLAAVYRRICYYNRQHPTSLHWQPSATLQKLAVKDHPTTTDSRSHI
jgi:enoyl-CoA hydratase/3-hydroxyacyl-CoA dehydrogenase/3,2-trans-enoyl-CoA isomerase